MNNQSLLNLRKEILDCTNEDRILELEINLKHLIIVKMRLIVSFQLLGQLIHTGLLLIQQ